MITGAEAMPRSQPGERGTELLERGSALAALAGLLEDVSATGHGRLVLVRGEAGVGKTALVRRFTDDAAPVRVLRGTCDPLYTPRPLGPFLDIAHTTGGELERAATGGVKPYEVAAALMRELEGAAPSVVLIEDVHWADEATLDVLRIVARRVETLPVLIVATYRDDELDRRHPLRRALGELNHGDRTTRLAVEPLSPEAVAALAAPHGVDADDLYRKTNGNAFFVTEVLAADGAEVPDTARDAVLARAARLSPEATELLEAVAIVPPHAEHAILEAIVPNGVDALEECLSSGMLLADGGDVFFRHELARLAIESSIPAHRRTELNRVVARGARSRRAARSPIPRGSLTTPRPPGDDAAVLRYAPVAGDRAAAAGAHREAADQFARALRAGANMAPAERGDLLERRAYSCYITDQNPEALAALREAIECYRAAGDRYAEGRAFRMLSNYLWCPGHVDESLRGRPARRRAAGAARARAASSAAPTAISPTSGAPRATTRPPRSGPHWRSTAGEEFGDYELMASALIQLGESEALAGIGPGFDKLDRATDARPRARPRRGNGLDRPRARPHAARSADVPGGRTRAEARAPTTATSAASSFTGSTTSPTSRWPSSSKGTGRAPPTARTASCARAAPRRLPTILALTTLALLRSRRGDPDPWSLLDEAQALAEASGELPRIGPVAAARAEALWLAGRTDEIEAATDSAFALALRAAARTADRRARALAADGRPGRRRAARGRRAVRPRAAWRLASKRRRSGTASAARTTRRSRSSTPATRRRCGTRSTGCRSSTRARPRRSSRAGSATAAPAASRAGRARRRAATRRD